MTLNVRLVSAILVIAVLPLILLSTVLSVSYRSNVIRAAEEHLRSAASIQRDRVAAMLAQNAERLALVSSRTQLRLSLAQHLQDRDDASRERMNRILADAAGSIVGLEEITVHDPGGLAVAATDPAVIGRVHPRRDLLDRARQAPFVDHVFRDEQGRPRVLLAGPMVLDGTVLGVIVIRSRVDNLYRALADTSGLGATGETILARRVSGDRWRFLAPTRFRPGAALEEFSSACTALPGSSTLHVDHASPDCVDYRGQRVLAVGRSVPGTDWSLVVKIDRAEVLAQLHRTGAWLLGLAAVLCVGVVLAALQFSRRLSRPLVDLASAASSIAAGDYTRQVPVRSSDEVGTLESSFNTMAIQVAAAHAGLEEKVRQLHEEIQNRRRVESEREALIAELTQALTEIRTLEGILPICAACKKIRDDKGYWNQLENYISEHSGARFSHGLCPDCLARYEAQLESDPPDPGPDAPAG